MSSSATKRKVDADCRHFNKNWTAKYLFTEVGGKAVCLVCGEQIAVDAATKTSFLISHKIAKNSKPFSEREFVKECLVDSAALICPDKKGAFEQKLVFLHCIIHQHVLCKSVLKMTHVIDVVNKIVNFIRARALNHRQFVALLEEHESEHSDIGYHTAVRWLSLGKVLKRVWDLKAEIQEFCEKKGKDIPELSDEHWMADFAFAVDVTALMNELNTKLQGNGLFVHEMHSLVKAFMRKLQFLSSQLESNTLTHMQTLKEVTPSADHLRRYSSMLGALHGEFSRRFEDLRTIEDEMHMISSPFSCSVDNAPSDVQLELIDLQSDAVLAEHFKSGSLLDFYSSLKEENFPNMRRHAQKMLFTKSTYRSSLTDDHLSAVLRISTSNIQPDFDALVKAQQRPDFSH
ncbi:hypothetical protein Q5P01_019971 [Channa striata]|uniref:Uncharacterized protein n=1 Tax=Channa striata TaxID=64152 RepID=A0AA88M2F8_CHASR|nr:hypothetical protein Q5P01_019971 [Channa striata]